MRSFIQPVKAGWQCGQQAKDSALPFSSQAHKMTFALIYIIKKVRLNNE